MGTVTIKKLDEDAYRLLKAEASRKGMNIGEAASEAFKKWVRSQKAKRAKDKLGMRKAIEHMDSTRTSSGEWSATEEIRRWRESRKK